MDKIVNALKNIWNSYKNWLGDKVWYKNWKVWLSVLVVLGVAGMGTDAEADEAESEEPEQEEVSEETQELMDEIEAIEEVPEEEAAEELTTQDVITNAAKDVLGDKLIEVEYMDASDHYNIYAKTTGLSVNMDRKGTYFNTSDVLEKIQDKEFGSLYFEYQAEFVDKYGDSEQRKGITYDLTKETVDKINFDSFLPENLPEIADSYWQHPAFN